MSAHWRSLRAGQARALIGLACCLALNACASHSDRLRAVHAALDRGEPQKAVAELNKHLGVKGADQLPTATKADTALLVLDRSVILQQLTHYDWSSRDLQFADKEIQMLDFSRTALHEVGKYLFSDDVGPYQAPTFEKLLINTVNMVNYLARGDLGGARVEVRRFVVMQKYLRDHADPSLALVPLGSYLAGFICEMSGQPDEAERFYREAFGPPRAPDRLAKATPGPQPPPPFTPPATTAKPCAEEGGCGTLLVVVSSGRVPRKVAKRVPIGLALTFAAPFLSPGNLALAGQGLVTWINYPELSPATGTRAVPHLTVNGQPVSLKPAMAVDREARKAWEMVKGPVMAAAIARSLVRVAAGQGLRAAAGGGGWATALTLIGQMVLSAADTPDTRSWSTLPARIQLARLLVPAGEHTVACSIRGVQQSRQVTVRANSWGAANFTEL